jgi:hypothetical protein
LIFIKHISLALGELNMTKTYLLAGLFALGLASAATAQTTFSNDVSIKGGGTEDQLCVGDNCANDEVYASNKVKIRIKDENTALEFSDVNDDDWVIEANQGGFQNLRMGNETDGRKPFVIEGSAPSNTLFLDSLANGDSAIGIGTSLPAMPIHIRAASARVRLDGTGATSKAWDIAAGSDIFFSQADRGRTRFVVEHSDGFPDVVRIDENGNLGLGITHPAGALHIDRNDGTGKIIVANRSGSGAQEMLLMQSDGGGYFTLKNTTSGRDWFFTHENNIGGRFIITSSTNPSQGLFLEPDGDMQIGGTLTTGGGTCGGGCDLVFTDGYALPSIAEHAEEMFTLGHLPNVGPTPENAPINVSDKLGRMLNELEHAHIFIAQQDAIISEMRAEQMTMRAELSELRTLVNSARSIE